MPVWGPGVEWPQARQDPEPNNKEREEEELKLSAEVGSLKLQKAEGLASFHP